MKNYFLRAIILVLLFTPLNLIAQRDTTYYDDYTSMITGRFYFSQKYTSLLLDNKNNSKLDLTYRPNTTFNMGIGATYNWFTLNLAYGFGFLNQDEERGVTDYLDLQAHFYGQKMNIDLFGEFYKGFYLVPEGKATNDGSFYLRPDLRVTELGASFQYIFNDKKLSFRAAQLQNQRQKKSAGSLLLGLEFYFGLVRADSSIYPAVIASDSLNSNQINFVEVGPSIGYAYSLVFLKNFYITASVAANVDLSFTNYINDAGTDSRVGISPNAMVRVFAGYNSAKSAVSLSFINNKVALVSAEETKVSINTGNFRINYVRRFAVGNKKNFILKTIDRIGGIKE